MKTNPLLHKVASHFFPHGYELVTSGSSTGMSGSIMAKVSCREKDWCLRAWPVDFSERRLRFIHDALMYAGTRSFRGVPALASTTEGDTVFKLRNQLFDAQEWVGGEPLSRAELLGSPLPNQVFPVGEGTLKAICTAVACFHLKTMGFRSYHQSVSTPFLKNPESCAYEMLEQKQRIENSIKGQELQVANRWLTLIPKTLSLASKVLEGYAPGCYGGSVLCHSDLWAGHIHFAGEKFIGFVDFEELRLGPPILDVVQVILHLNGWSSRDCVLSFYEEILELPARDKAMIPAAAVFDLISEGVWAMQCLYGETRTSNTLQEQAHQANLNVLLRSLEAIFSELKHKG